MIYYLANSSCVVMQEFDAWLVRHDVFQMEGTVIVTARRLCSLGKHVLPLLRRFLKFQLKQLLFYYHPQPFVVPQTAASPLAMSHSRHDQLQSQACQCHCNYYVGVRVQTG